MLEVFSNHYDKLQMVLPVKSFSGYFVAKQLINFEEEQIIHQTVGQIQAASIVLRKIAYSLRAGQTRSFERLLEIMRDHGGLSCEELANQMRGELAENTRGTVAIV